MGSTNLDLIIIIFFFFFFVISKIDSIQNIKDFDDNLIRSYAFRDTRRHKTGSLYEISLPTNLSYVKASIITIRNSMFWRKGANFSGVYVPPLVKTTPYAKRIAFVFEDFSSPVYFRLSENYSFVSPVIGFNVYDAGNELEKLNLSIKKENPILIRFDTNVLRRQKKRGGIIKCVEFGGNSLSYFSNTTRSYECSTMNSRGHYALVVVNRKHEPELVKWKWWFVVAVIGILILIVVVIIFVVKLVKKKRLKEMERESEKSEVIGNIWIRGGRSRMPTANMVRTQPSLEYHEDVPSSSIIP